MGIPLRVLIVEDSEDDALLLVLEIRRGGYDPVFERVDTAETMSAALEDKTWDIILADYVMPQFSGLEALKVMQRSGIDLPFIVVSGKIVESTAIETMKAGAHDYIMKGNLAKLIPTVRRELHEADERRKRKEAERALRESEERFRIALKNSHVLVFNQDRQLHYTWVYNPHPNFCTETILGKTDTDLFQPDEASNLTEIKRQVLETGIGAREEMQVILNGKQLFYDLTIEPLRDSAGAVVGITCSGVDITEHKRAEEALRESEERLHNSVETMLDGFAIFSAIRDDAGNIIDFRYEYINEAGCKLNKRTREELVGHTMLELLPGHKDTDLFYEYIQLVETGQPLAKESLFYEDVYGGGLRLARYYDIRAVRLGNGFAVTWRDITEKVKFQAQLLQTQRMESIGTLAGGLAHNINNMLTPMMLSLQMLKQKYTDEQSQKLFNILETNAQHSADLIKQVLSFTRGIEGEHKTIQVTDLISDIEKIAKQTFPKSIEIRADISGDLWNISGDATQLHQVLMNMCVNARDAMPDGGILSISAENLLVDENYARVNIGAKVGSYVVITVSDTGTGIPPKILDRIFEPFFTTKEFGKGTGLGLSVSLAIVKSHGGFMNVHSEIGKGTTFKIHLPATATEIQKQDELQHELLKGRGESILVVDDEPSVRDITSSILKMNGYKVIPAGDGVEAITLYLQYRDEIKAVLMDMMMPVMEGPESIRALHKINPEIRIIAVSGLTEKDKLAKVPSNHVKAFLPKPYTAGVLLKIIYNVLSAK